MIILLNVGCKLINFIPMGSAVSQNWCMEDSTLQQPLLISSRVQHPVGSTSPHVLEKSMVAEVQQKESFLGSRVEMILVLQAAEIERLRTQIQQIQASFLQSKSKVVHRYPNQLNTSECFAGAERDKEVINPLGNEISFNQESIKIPHDNPKQRLEGNWLVLQIQALKRQNYKLAAQNNSLKQQLQQQTRQKGELQSRLSQITGLYQKANCSEYDKFRQYQQKIKQKNEYIKKLKKRLKERILEIRTLNYELQESQTNQYVGSDENQQQVFLLSNLLLKKDQAKERSEIFSNSLGASEASKSIRKNNQFLRSKSQQNSNFLMVPGSRFIRPGSSMRKDQSLISNNKSTFLRVIQELPMRGSTSKIQHRNSTRNREESCKAVQGSDRTSQFLKIKRKALGLESGLKVKGERQIHNPSNAVSKQAHWLQSSKRSANQEKKAYLKVENNVHHSGSKL